MPLSWLGKLRRRQGREALPASSDETDYQTVVVAADEHLDEAEAFFRRLGSREDVAKLHPDLLLPQLHLDNPYMAQSYLFVDSRSPRPGEIPDWMILDHERRSRSHSVRVLEDAELWLRPGADPESAHLNLRSRRVLGIVDGVFLALHAQHDAAAIDLIRRRGNDLKPAYDLPMDVASWAVPVWRDVARAKRWMFCCLFAGGKSVADLAINGTNIIVEV